MAAPKLGLDKTMELLSRVLRAGDEDSELSALSAALKAKLGPPDWEKRPPTMSSSVEPLTRFKELQRHPQLRYGRLS